MEVPSCYAAYIKKMPLSQNTLVSLFGCALNIFGKILLGNNDHGLAIKLFHDLLELIPGYILFF